jgi:hypothetical protein
MIAALLAVEPAAFAGHVISDNGSYRFVEDFRWQGNHAATIAAGAATTVWLDESSWDVRGDTAYIAVTPLTDDGIAFTNAFHVDIHKAASTDPRSGVIDNTHYVVGGDGSAGVGIFHLDYQDILSARLRNPLLISAAQPGVVRFYAPLFNTTGHWWELAITPADHIIGGEHTTVPSVNSGLPEPGSPNDAQPGPGHDTAADSLNLVAFGSADYPCLGFPGWRTRFGISKTQNGARSHYITQSATQGDFVQTDPSQANTLVLWEVRYYPDHVSLSADFDGDGNVSALESWPVTLPWSEVHVHLMAVGYQSTHHPASTCNLGQIREIQWRNVDVYPVKYARTDVFPKNAGTQQLPKDLGFSSYDLRDIQRRGVVNGVAQPNDLEFSANHPGKYCVDGGFPCFSSTPKSPNLALGLPANVRDGLVGANVLADMKDAAGDTVHASASATLNGTALGRFPEHDAVLTETGGWAEWVRRALPTPPAAVHAGANTLGLTLETGAYVDRVELELLYGPGPDLIFRNGFDGGGSTAAASNYRAPASGELRIAYPLFPVGSDKHLLHQCGE